MEEPWAKGKAGSAGRWRLDSIEEGDKESSGVGENVPPREGKVRPRSQKRAEFEAASLNSR